MRWISLVLRSIVFWLIWLTIALIVTYIHGDCSIHPTEFSACVTEKRWVGGVVIVIAVAFYVSMLRQLLRKPRKGD